MIRQKVKATTTYITTTASVNITSMPITTLSNPLLLHIFSFLTLDSWIPLQLTCQRFYKLTFDNELLLQSWCFNKLPDYLNAGIPLPPDTNYKWLTKCLTNDSTFKYGFELTSDQLYIRQVTHEITDPRQPMLIRYIISIGIKYCNSDKTYTIGTRVNGRMQGYGYHIDQDDSYHGEFVNNQCHGLGTWHYKEGDVYHGYSIDGFPHGHGKYTFASGAYYQGQWENGLKKGTGRYQWPCGSSYVGQFDNDLWNGLGTYTRIDDGQVTAVHYGIWKDQVPIGCNFGYLFYTCDTCDIEVCSDCVRLHHSNCKVKRTWTSMMNESLGCHHSKEALGLDSKKQ